MNQEPGPSTTQSASPTAVTASAQAGGSAGINEIDRTRPVVSAQATWPRTVLIRIRPVRICPCYFRGEIERHRRHRQHPAVRAEQPANPVEALDGIAEQFPERHDQDIADRVPAKIRVPGEPVLDNLAPGGAPVVIAAQRRQRHPQVAGRQHAELAAQPAARAAVIGDRDDGGELAGDPAQGGERGEQPVAAAERHDLAAVRPGRRLGLAAGAG